MGPVGAPEDAVGVGLVEGGDHGGGGLGLAGGEEAVGDLDVGFAGGEETEEGVEAGLEEAEIREGAGDMIDADRDGGAGEKVFESGDDFEAGEELEVPAEAGNTVEEAFDGTAGGFGAGGSRAEIETGATEAGAGELVEGRGGGGVVNDGDAAGGGATGAEAEESGGVVRAVDGGSDDDDAVDAEAAVEGGHLVGEGGGGSVGAAGEEGEAAGVAEDVGVGVAGVLGEAMGGSEEGGEGEAAGDHPDELIGSGKLEPGGGWDFAVAEAGELDDGEVGLAVDGEGAF